MSKLDSLEKTQNILHILSFQNILSIMFYFDQTNQSKYRFLKKNLHFITKYNLSTPFRGLAIERNKLFHNL